jgi:NTP pyrophosphatase (non-canonical NTP hydrolase)
VNRRCEVAHRPKALSGLFCGRQLYTAEFLNTDEDLSGEHRVDRQILPEFFELLAQLSRTGSCLPSEQLNDQVLYSPLIHYHASPTVLVADTGCLMIGHAGVGNPDDTRIETRQQATGCEGFMKLKDYQEAARQTDQRPGDDLPDIAVHLLGMLGEAGSVATEYKKLLRDGAAHTASKARMREELGDLLWYTATLATKLGLDLDDVARANLEKTRDRWLRTSSDSLDDQFPERERLPRDCRFEFVASANKAGRPTVRVRYGGDWVGDPLTDASHVDDGYRFHDVFHLGYAAALGWSPVTRKLLGRKRRSEPETDEAEDGGRAIVTEEGIAAMVFAYATSHSYLDGISRLDFQLLDVIKTISAPFEVGVRTAADWEQAILTGFAAWRKLRDNNGGIVLLDASKRAVTVDTSAA